MRFEVEKKTFDSAGNTIQYGLIPWDSEIFGFNVAEIFNVELSNLETTGAFFSEFEKQVKMLGVRLLVAKVSAYERHIFYEFQRSGYIFIEETINPYIVNLQKSDVNYAKYSKITLKNATEVELPAIREIASTTFEYDRFHLDFNLDANLANKRYSVWIDNSYRSNDDVLYAELNGNVAGFSIVRIDGQSASLPLIGIANPHKGTAIGLFFYMATCNRLKELGVKAVSTTISLNNINVLNIYSRCGFSFKDPVFVLHKWIG